MFWTAELYLSSNAESPEYRNTFRGDFERDVSIRAKETAESRGATHSFWTDDRYSNPSMVFVDANGLVIGFANVFPEND